ncbi:MAG: YcgN family cysteine cluster protein [Desulfobacterales bacterium]|nr:YcgN family cysteine cluster protein [Desulfobacterales bacterium]
MHNPIKPFWKIKPLSEMTRKEWESLCDGCGRCCLEKLENKKTGKVYYTNVACPLLDPETCRCKSYKDRKALMPFCLSLTPENINKFRWLPGSCAYRLLAEGKELAWWHPLVSGNADTVRQAGISVCGKVISSEHIHPDDLENYIVDWKIWTRHAQTLEAGF